MPIDSRKGPFKGRLRDYVVASQATFFAICPDMPPSHDPCLTRDVNGRMFEYLETYFPPLVVCDPFFGAACHDRKSRCSIMTFSQQPDWDEPWNDSRVRGSTACGFVIEGNRNMTNAHVVSWAKQIQVRRFQDSRPHLAEVAYIGHDCDLAVLTVEDPSFFEGLDPLPIGVLPKVRSVVNTIGYPAGGEQISFTSGVVSRIELINYVQPGNRSLLAVQTDAAINPGNSGGPVLGMDRSLEWPSRAPRGLKIQAFSSPHRSTFSQGH